MKLAIRSTLYVVVLTVLLGGVYPAAVTASRSSSGRTRPNGSFVTAGGRVVGSELIGQNFKSPAYLHPRPSAAGKDGYDATASAGTEQGPDRRRPREGDRGRGGRRARGPPGRHRVPCPRTS